MRKLTISVVILAVIAAVAGLLWQQQQLKRATAETADLREQIAAEIPALRQENQGLRRQLKETEERMESNLSDLMRLRGQSVKMRQLEEEIARLKAERDRVVLAEEQADARASEDADQRNMAAEIDQRIGAGTEDLIIQAKHWASTLKAYAAAHEGQYPNSLAEAFSAADWLPAENQARMMSGINRFELVYHGNWDDLANLPTESIIVVRERRPWVGEDGKWHKTYGMAPGMGAIETSDDPGFFAEWEAVRIAQ